MYTPLPAALHLATASLAPALLTPRVATSLASAPALLRQLAQASLMGTLFVLSVWLLCRLAPRLPAGLRCALWWLACLKLLLGLAWPAPVALPLLPPAAAAAAGWLASPAAPAQATAPILATGFPGGVSAPADAARGARPAGAVPAAAGAARTARTGRP